MAEDEVPYTILIHTGAYYPQIMSSRKWNDGSMILIINPGNAVESQKMRVKDWFPIDTEGLVTADFWLPATLGEPKLLKVDLESNKYEVTKVALYVREVTILYDSKTYRFPIKNYVYPHNPIRGNPTVAKMGCPPHFLVREGAGTLKHLEKEEYLLAAREEDITTIQSMVEWNVRKDTEHLLPGYLQCMEYKNLPRFLKFREAKLEAFLNLRLRGRTAVLKAIYVNVFQKAVGKYKVGSFDSLERYKQYFKERGDEMQWSKSAVKRGLNVADISHNDAEFGRQMLCGPNAMYIRKIGILEERWLGAGEIPEYIFEGKKLTEVLSAGRLYEITCDMLDGIKHGGSFSKKLCGSAQTWYVILADCMFYLNESEELVPVLIRLENRNDGEEATFWYPPKSGVAAGDPQYLAWLLAKMYFRSSDLQIYSLCTHFARAHCLNEVFAVSAYRNLPNAHPIFRFLQPHIHGIIPVNVQARAVLVNPGENVFSLFLSAGDELHNVISKYFKQTNYKDFVIPDDVEARGVGDLPGYLYRDDTTAHWNILKEYIREAVDLAYQDDENIVKDTELQTFVKDVVDRGLDGFENGAGFPSSFANREELVEYLTVIIFNISVFHTAVNFQTLTVSGYIPNNPCCMRLPPPQQEDIITMQRILDTLPVKEISFIQMNVSYNLQQFSPTERFYLGTPAEHKMGMIGENMVVAPEQIECIMRLIERMKQLKEKIRERNEGKFVEYDVLSPDNIPLTTQT